MPEAFGFEPQDKEHRRGLRGHVGGDPAACAPLGGKSPRGNTPLGDEAPLPRDYIEVREKREAQQSKGELPGPDEAISGRSHSRDAKGE